MSPMRFPKLGEGLTHAKHLASESIVKLFQHVSLRFKLNYGFAKNHFDSGSSKFSGFLDSFDSSCFDVISLAAFRAQWRCYTFK